MTVTWPIVLLLYVINICDSKDADISWTWLTGSVVANPLQRKDDPGGRSGAAYWLEPDQQAVWVFGGEHHIEHDQPGLRNDLWKLDLTSLTWQQVHNGSGAVGQVPQARQLGASCGVQGAYFLLFGGLGEKETVLGDTWLFYIPEGKWYKLDDIRVKLGAKNLTDGQVPDDRGDMAAWCRSDFDLTIFGGFGKDDILLHDMWRFDMQQMAWEEAPSSSKLPADPDFVKHLWYPRSRSGAVTWVNDTGNLLYLFGGNVQHKNVRSKHMNTGNSGDLWVYDISRDKWTYLQGTRWPCLQPGSYGNLGQASVDSHPGCRRRAASWTDTNANLWMFGGDGVDDSQSSISVFRHSKLLSDLWFYDTEDNMWTWKGGLKSGDGKGSYGKKGEAGKHNLPGSRCEAIVWSFSNFLYLLGGVGHDSRLMDGYLNDIWLLNVAQDSSVSPHLPGVLPVLGIVFLGIGLLGLLFVGFMCNRGFYKDGDKKLHKDDTEQRGQYKPLIDETEQ